MIFFLEFIGVLLIALGLFIWSLPLGLIFVGIATLIFVSAWEKKGRP